MKQKICIGMLICVMLLGLQLKASPLRLSETDICYSWVEPLAEFHPLKIEQNQMDRVSAAPLALSVKHEAHDRDAMKGLVGHKEKLEQIFPRPWSAEELLLAQLLEAEAGTQGFRGKQLVADVVINRVHHGDFPDTIREVIFQRHQFSVILDGRFDRMAGRITEESLKAARSELEGPRIDTRILYFNSGNYCMNGSNPWKYKDHWFAY